MKTVIALRLSGPPVEGGSWSPFFECRDPKGNIIECLVKFMENKQSLRILANELVTYELAQVLGVPLPAHFLVYMPRSLAQDQEVWSILERETSPGPHFGVERMRDIYANPPTALIKSCANIKDYPGFVLLDCLVYNVDRLNLGNFLISTAGDELRYVPIDFGHAFGGPRWDTALVGLASDPLWDTFPEILEMIAGVNPFGPWLERAKELTSERVSSIIAQIPEGWDVPPSHRMALHAFIMARVARLGGILASHQL